MNYELIAYAQDFASFLLQNLQQEADKINQIILFGSVARGEAGKKSDVDLFVDVTDEKIERKINQLRDSFYNSVKAKKYWTLLGIRNEINFSIGKLEEWEELKRSIIANGIILYGKYLGELKTIPFTLFVITPSKVRKRNVMAWRRIYGYHQKIGKKQYVHKGLVEEYKGNRLSTGVFIVPAEYTQKVALFLKKYKFTYKIIPLWLEKK